MSNIISSQPADATPVTADGAHDTSILVAALRAWSRVLGIPSGKFANEDCAAAADLIESQAAEIAELRRQREGYQRHLRECEQIAGRALGYPRYEDDQKNFPGTTDADGVCVGDHIADTVVAELAEAYAKSKEAATPGSVGRGDYAD